MDAAGVEEDDAVGEVEGFVEVVGDEEDGLLEALRRSRIICCISRRVRGSSAPKGSSMSRMGGSAARARARPARWRWPPESWRG